MRQQRRNRHKTSTANPWPWRRIHLWNLPFLFFDSWPGYEAAFAIDGNRGHEEFDHAAHPEKGAHIASFFVQSTNESVVYYVEV